MGDEACPAYPPEWEVRVSNLQKHYASLPKSAVVQALLEKEGHAGGARDILDELQDPKKFEERRRAREEREQEREKAKEVELEEECKAVEAELEEAMSSLSIRALKKAIDAVPPDRQEQLQASLEKARGALKEEVAKRAASEDKDHLTEEQVHEALKLIMAGRELRFVRGGGMMTLSVTWHEVDGFRADTHSFGETRRTLLPKWDFEEGLMEARISDPDSYAHHVAKW